MASKINYDKLSELIQQPDTTWIEQVRWMEDNKNWLAHSRRIAVKILLALQSKGLTQKDLAEKIDVSPQYISKIAKGKENLSLQTISTLEQALQLKLIEVPEFTSCANDIQVPARVPLGVQNPFTSTAIKHESLYTQQPVIQDDYSYSLVS